MMKNILLVDDEPKIMEVLHALYESKGFKTFQAGNGRTALEISERENLSLIILDLMLPDISGEEVCRRIRQHSRVPIIMLTAKVREDDLLHGFDMGADDYITKPFSLKELSARSAALLRRSGDDLIPLTTRNSFGEGDLFVDFDQGIVRKKDKEVMLTATEMKLLATFVKYAGKVFTRSELINLALGDDFDGYDRAVDSHIKNLRQKIEDDPKNPVYIRTVHRLGYKFGGNDAK
ncbi:response regulator transcription factor [Blautia liquoris]|uniref:Stage 0 sporulation protein A homolog n=1 Tax=Blautia liquoris TaxID=2779518 RepID=A0A7M2RCM2_9FIRM|nr:response regulator transcription factor [Blautia liquoris]QOV18079.1 response regulator transcription factor [Blautia liquoris]